MAQALANALVPIFIGLLLGYWGGRRGWLDRNGVGTLIAVVMNIAVPCAMFSAITRTTWSSVTHVAAACWIVAATFLLMFVLVCIGARRFVRAPLGDAAVLALTLGFPNCAAVAISLLADLYGPESRVLASLSIAIGALTISPLTLALLDMQSGSDEQKIEPRKFFLCVLRSFSRPVVWAPLAGLLLLLLQVHLPGYVASSLRVLGDGSSGTALLLTGLILSSQGITISFGAVLSTILKLVVQPAIALGLCLLFHVDKLLLREVTLICAIPAGFFGLVFGKRYQATPALAGSSLILTYLFSVVSLPAWAFVLNRIL